MSAFPSSATTRRTLHAAACLTLLAACRDDATGPSEAGPVAAAESDVTVASPTVASGDSVLLTLTTRDAQGRAVSRGGHSVTFVASGGSSTGVIGAASDRGNGTYVASFKGVVAGLATTIGATIDAQPVTRPLPTIRVRPGTFSPATSTLSITPRTVLPGGKATLELIARDAAGNRLETGGLHVTLTIAGGSAIGTLGPVTDHNDGRYTATFTATQVGTPISLTATADGKTVTSPPARVAVARGVSTDLSVITVTSDSVRVNASVDVRLEVYDSAAVRRTSGGDSVRFVIMNGPNTSEGTIGTVTDHDDGSYTAKFTATREGEPVRIGFSINGRSRNAALPSVVVLGIPIVPQKSTVSVSADTIEAGKSATFSVLLFDVDGAPVTSAAGSVQFTITNADGYSSGSIGPTVDEGEGRYTASFKGTRAGDAATVGVTIGDSTQVQMLDSLGNSHLPAITVRPGPATADSSLVFVDPSEINVRDSATVRLVARDAYGNVLAKGGATVTFKRAGGAGVSVGHLGPVSDLQDGRYTARYFADTAGTPDSIYATLDGRSVTTPAPTITVGPACTPGPIDFGVSYLTINDNTLAHKPVKSDTLPSGVTTTLTVTVKDGFGCPVQAAHNVVFAQAGGGGSSTGVLGATINLEDGRYIATYTGHTAGSTTRIEATIDGTPLTSAPVHVTVVPGDISTRTSELSASATAASVGAPVVLTLRGRDAAGNTLTVGGRAVTFVVAGNQTHGAIGATTDHGNGTYSATYTGASAGSDTIVVFIDGTRVTQTVTLTVQN